jgi:acyl-CoA thioesterase FadM
VAASCEFQSPARCEEVLDIEVTVLRIGTKSVTYGFAIRREGRDVASGEMTSVCCLVAHGQNPKAVAIPEEIADKLRQFMAE